MQVLEPGQSAPVRLSNMIARPACVVRQNLDTRGRRPGKCDRIARVRVATFALQRPSSKISWLAQWLRHQCARRLGRQPQLSRPPRASEVSRYLHTILEMITIPADVEKSQRGSLMVGSW